MTRHTRWIARVVVLLVVAGIVVFAVRTGLFHSHDMGELRGRIEHVQRTPHLRAIFVVVYALCSAVGVPASTFTLAGGALFGFMQGTALNWVAANLGAMLGFLGTRVLAGAPEVRAQRVPEKLRTLNGDGAPMLLFRLRLIPVVPFALLNVGSALSTMSWRSFALATAIGIIPIVVIYTMFATSLIAGVAGSGARAFWLAMASAASIIAITFVARRSRPPERATERSGLSSDPTR